MFNQCYGGVIKNLKKMFEYPKIADILADNFEKDCKSYEGSKLSLVEQKHQYLMLLIQGAYNNKLKVPFDHQIPETDEELTKREIIMFLLFKRLRYEILPDESIMMKQEQNLSNR